MARVEHKTVVIKGKGEFSNSLTAMDLDMGLARLGHPHTAGIAEAAASGPYVPKMLDMRGQEMGPGHRARRESSPQRTSTQKQASLILTNQKWVTR